MEEICKTSGLIIENHKILIPEWVKHIKLDIGLGRYPIYSRDWLKKEPDTLIFGFEPAPDALESINANWIITKEEMGKNFFLIPVALSENSNTFLDFYMTKPKCESSSLLKPTQEFLDHYNFTCEKIQVPCFSLKDFFDYLPLDTIPYIEYVKIDAQGMDLNIVRSGENTIKEKVVYITLEADGYQYENSESLIDPIDTYMKSIGFIKIDHPNTQDPTYFNSRFESIKDDIYICQKS
jgi:FkbM family methyltransferase